MLINPAVGMITTEDGVPYAAKLATRLNRCGIDVIDFSRSTVEDMLWAMADIKKILILLTPELERHNGIVTGSYTGWTEHQRLRELLGIAIAGESFVIVLNHPQLQGQVFNGLPILNIPHRDNADFAQFLSKLA